MNMKVIYINSADQLPAKYQGWNNSPMKPSQKAIKNGYPNITVIEKNLPNKHLNRFLMVLASFASLGLVFAAEKFRTYATDACRGKRVRVIAEKTKVPLRKDTTPPLKGDISSTAPFSTNILPLEPPTPQEGPPISFQLEFPSLPDGWQAAILSAPEATSFLVSSASSQQNTTAPVPPSLL